MRRRRGIIRKALAIGSIAMVPAMLLGAAQPRPVDVIIRGGTVFAGDADGMVGDVAITGDRIVAVAPTLSLPARRTIDARGMIVAPGFIDPHAHVEDWIGSPKPATRLIPAFLMQGVTTAFIGNDGYGSPDIAARFAAARARPPGINFAAYAGFGAIRGRVMGGANRAPTPAELARMQALVKGAMCQGALGLSTGLFYAPQSFAKTDEVVALARVAAAHGGHYDSHIRDESSYTIGLAAAVDEAIEIGRKGGLHAHIAHIKALGVDVHGTSPAIIAKVEAARRAGQFVTADQYPWSASGTSLAASLVPLWAQPGGTPALARLNAAPATRRKLIDGMADNLRRRGGAASLLITQGPHRGRTLAQVAQAMKKPPVEAAIAVILVADPPVASFNQTEGDIAAFMAQPWVMTGSDASAGHPRTFGSFARKYATYVKERKVLSLRDFIQRSSTLAADTFALEGRGRITPGGFADIVVFDPKAHAPRATYEQPMLTATGVRSVLVNGVLAVDNGRLTGRAAGRPLPHVPTPGSCNGT